MLLKPTILADKAALKVQKNAITRNNAAMFL